MNKNQLTLISRLGYSKVDCAVGGGRSFELKKWLIIRFTPCRTTCCLTSSWASWIWGITPFLASNSFWAMNFSWSCCRAWISKVVSRVWAISASLTIFKSSDSVRRISLSEMIFNPSNLASCSLIFQPKNAAPRLVILPPKSKWFE